MEKVYVKTTEKYRRGAGHIVAMDKDTAERHISAKQAEKATEAEIKAHNEREAKRAEASKPKVKKSDKEINLMVKGDSKTLSELNEAITTAKKTLSELYEAIEKFEKLKKI